MRRSICYTEPTFVLAGQVGTWKFCFVSAVNLPAGTSIKFDLLTSAKPSDWEIPVSKEEDKNNTIWLIQPSGKICYPGKGVLTPQYSFYFEFFLTEEVVAGQTITICMGSLDNNSSSGNKAQTLTQRRRPFHLYFDPKGKSSYKDPEIFSLDIKGNVLKNIKLIAPSLVSKNKRFDVFVRFEDEYGNLTGNSTEGALVELSYENLRENLSWKLFIPETGFISIPNLYFNEVNVYRIKLFDTSSKKTFYSSPIKCLADISESIYWGLFHGESEKFNATDSIESCLRHMRDERGLNFYAASPFENEEETPAEIWKTITQYIYDLNEDEHFVTFLGMQWAGTPGKEGLRHIIYTKDQKSLLRKKDAKNNSLSKIYSSHTPRDLISIISFSMAKGMHYSFENFSPDFEKLVEIYNAWGSSECSEKEGNIKPIKSLENDGYSETSEGSVRKALNNNYRFGFVAGGLDDRGVYDSLYEGGQIQYTPGLTAIIAPSQSKENILAALRRRHCFATTGAQMVIGFFIAGFPMGTEITTTEKPGLALNRHITGFIAGTNELEEVLIIRNGVPFKVYNPSGVSSFEFALDDFEKLDKSVITPENGTPFVYYYLRVTQKDGHIAWTSPIWVDHTRQITMTTPSSPKKTKKKS